MDLHFTTAPTPRQWADWQWQLNHAARSLKEAAAYLGMPESALTAGREAEAKYPVFVTPYYLSLAEKADFSDPIIRQCLAHDDEICRQGGGAPDALAEEVTSPVARLVHRYPDRALFITGNFCATRCRHCMRKRHWAESMSVPSREELHAAADYLRANPQVREVLISGGDPLMLPEDALREIISVFSAVPSVEMLRIGSRMPVVLPQRITPRLAAVLSSGKTAWLATHFNHPAELTPAAKEACDILVRAGIPLVNQSVLLKGVNDNAETLGRLFTGLLKMRIKPYYLFHGDPIEGTMHFRTGVQCGLDIMNSLRGKISGMALPAYAIDLPGGQGKVRLQPEHSLGQDSSGASIYPSYTGSCVPYPD
ncbi:MAG: KamA family radical SAM protein [Victivallales bacterium]|nr:KamA family radical SAM protein [Victivallales bacterium]